MGDQFQPRVSSVKLEKTKYKHRAPICILSLYYHYLILKDFFILLKMDYDLVAKMHVNELKKY